MGSKLLNFDELGCLKELIGYHIKNILTESAQLCSGGIILKGNTYLENSKGQLLDFTPTFIDTGIDEQDGYYFKGLKYLDKASVLNNLFELELTEFKVKRITTFSSYTDEHELFE